MSVLKTLIRSLFASLIILGLTLAPRIVNAQQDIVALTGAVMHEHGDTVIYQHDTTALTEVIRGDTVTRIDRINGRDRETVVFALHGDSATVVHARWGDGPWAASRPRVVSKRSATGIHRMLDQEREQAAFRARLARERPDKVMPMITPPERPDWPKTYVLWSRVRLLQHLDTIKRVHDCPGREWPDTTVFVFYGADSVKRIRPDPRRFGFVMKQTLIGEMRSSLIRVTSGTPLSLDDRMPHPGDMACAPHR